MNNAVTLITLLLQNLTQLQSFAGTLQKAIAEGRDVTPEELGAARAALQSHIETLQQQIDSLGG